MPILLCSRLMKLPTAFDLPEPPRSRAPQRPQHTSWRNRQMSKEEADKVAYDQVVSNLLYLVGPQEEAEKVEHDKRVQAFIDKMASDVRAKEKARKAAHQELMDAAKADRALAASDRALAAKELEDAKVHKERVLNYIEQEFPGYREKYKAF